MANRVGTLIEPPEPADPIEVGQADLASMYVVGGEPPFWLVQYVQWARSLPLASDALQRELRPDIYEQMLTYPAVAQVVKSVLKPTILADSLAILSAADDDALDADKRQAQEITDFCQRAVDGLATPITAVLANMLDALALGSKTAEIVLRKPTSGPDSGKWTLDEIAPKNRRAAQFVVDPFMRILGIWAPTPAGGGWTWSNSPWGLSPDQLKNVLPREHFFVFTWDICDGDPRGQSILRPAYVPWWSAVQLGAPYLSYLTQFAGPSLVGILPENAQAIRDPVSGAVTSAAQVMANQLKSFKAGSFLVVGHGADVKGLYPPGEGRAYLEAFRRYDEQITHVVLGAARGVKEAKSGSRADSQTAQEVTGGIVTLAQNALAEAFRRDVLAYLVRLNWGDDAADLFTPICTLSQAEKRDQAALWTAGAALRSAGGLDDSQMEEWSAQVGLPRWDNDAIQAAKAEQAQAAQEAQQAQAAQQAQPTEQAPPKAGEAAPAEPSGEFYSPDQPRDEHGRWVSGGGSAGASAAAAGTSRTEASDRAHALVTKIKADQAAGRTAKAADVRKLHDALAQMTVKQIHALKSAHGLKASGPRKADLVNKLHERLIGSGKAGVQPTKPAVAKPPASKPTAKPSTAKPPTVKPTQGGGLAAKAEAAIAAGHAHHAAVTAHLASGRPPLEPGSPLHTDSPTRQALERTGAEFRQAVWSASPVAQAALAERVKTMTPSDAVVVAAQLGAVIAPGESSVDVSRSITHLFATRQFAHADIPPGSSMPEVAIQHFPSLSPLRGLMHPDADTPVARAELADLGRMPAAVLHRLAQSGFQGVYVGASKVPDQDKNQDLKNIPIEMDVHHSRAGTYDDVAGIYRTDRRLATSGGSYAGKMEGVILHEVGHAIGDLHGLDHLPEIRETHVRLYDKLIPYVQQGHPGGQVGMSELFAEGVRTYASYGREATAAAFDHEFADYLKHHVFEWLKL